MAYKDQSRGLLPNVSYVCIDGLAAATSRIDQVHGRTGKKITEKGKRGKGKNNSRLLLNFPRSLRMRRKETSEMEEKNPPMITDKCTLFKSLLAEKQVAGWS